jgi:DNA-binding GntR family transcriptional regulator
LILVNVWYKIYLMYNSVNKTCSEQIFEILKERIVAGYYSPNVRLLYNTIADELNVSISPVREAFLNLEKIGLVTIIPRKGVYVRQICSEDYFEYSQIRFALESLAIERICEIGISAEDVAVLREINNTFYASLKSSGPTGLESINLDNALHKQFILDSKMTRLVELTEMMPIANLRGNLRALANLEKSFLDRGEQIFKTHENIINALVEKNAQLAKSLLYQNVIAPLNEIGLDDK